MSVPGHRADGAHAADAAPRWLSGHSTPLDGLRAVAVGAVMLNHLSSRVFPGGHVGVDLFFVLSGFLITTLLARELDSTNGLHLGLFYLRRTIRLAPALAIMLLVCFTFLVLTGGFGPGETLGFAGALLYAMDFVRSFSHRADLSIVGHTWSLAIEEQFYLVWPLALPLLLRLRPRIRLILLGVLIGAVALWRLVLIHAGGAAAHLYFGLDTRMDQLLIGCALAMLLRDFPRGRWIVLVRRCWPAGLALLGYDLVTDVLAQAIPALEYSVTALIAAVLILRLVTLPDSKLAVLFSIGPLVRIGWISYGLYLWHYPILLEIRFRTLNKAVVLAGFAAAFAIATLSYIYAEQPLLARMRRTLRLRQRTPQPAIP